MSKIPLYLHSDIADPMRGVNHMPAAAIAIISAAATTFGPVLLGGAAATIGSLGVFGSFLLRAGLGLAVNALSQSQSSRGTTGGYKVTASGSALNHQIVYGQARCAPVRVFDSSTGSNNSILHRVLAFAGHEIEEFSSIYIGDELVTLDAGGVITSPAQYAGYVRILKKLGTNSQTAFTEMVTEVPEWTTNHRLRGIAYLYVRFTFNKDAYTNGIPEITAVVKGKKVYDPRTATTVYSSNAALCLRDYLTNTQYGLGAPNTEIDDALVQTAANISDQTVESIKRYSCDGNFTTASQPIDIIRSLLTSMGGLLWYSQGKWRMKAASYTLPVESFTLDDIVSEINVSTRNSRHSNFNVVRGTFRGAETNWQTTDYTKVSDPFFLTEDNGQESQANLDLPFTSRNLAAQRIARVFLKRNREQISLTASFGLKAFRVQVGDNVMLTIDRYGWTSKVFEVLSWTFTITDEMELQVRMSLRETSSSVYTDASGSLLALNNTSLPSPRISSAPTSLAAVNAGFISKDGKFTNGIAVTWNAIPDAFVTAYVIKWKKTTATKWNTIIVDEDTNFDILSAEDDIAYNIKVKGINQVLNTSGPFASITHTTGKDTTAPAIPTSITATAGFKSITLSWIEPTATDFNHVEVWEATTNNFAVATLVARAPGSTYTRSPLPSNSLRYYWLKSVDNTGNTSTNSASVSATTQKIVTVDVTDQNITRAQIETGAVSDLFVTFSDLLITDDTSSNYGAEIFLTQHTHAFGTTADTSPEELSTTFICDATGLVLDPAVTTVNWKIWLRFKIDVFRKNKTTAVETLVATVYSYAHEVTYLDGYAKFVFNSKSTNILQFTSSVQNVNTDLVFKYYWRKARSTTAGGIAITDATVSASTIALFR